MKKFSLSFALLGLATILGIIAVNCQSVTTELVIASSIVTVVGVSSIVYKLKYL